jgi:putative hydrolase of the HAD superfamily
MKLFAMLSSLSMNTNFALIMVDMGGVLALHTDTGMEKLLLRDFGLQEYDSFSELDPTLPDLLQEHSKNCITEEQMWERFTQKTGIVVPPYKGSLWAKYFQPELDQAMLQLLSELKQNGYRVVCATNTEAAHYEHHKAMQHYAVFDTVYASCEIGKAKPEPEFFTHILQCENVQGEQVIFIDDNAKNCEVASSLGIRAYHYEDISDLRWALLDMEMIQ